MKTFPRSLRILPLATVLQMIMAIYIDKAQNDAVLATKKMPSNCMGDFVFDYFLKNFGVLSIAEVNTVQFLTACAYHTTAHRRVALFAFQIGLKNTEVHPDLDVRDTAFILSVVTSLLELEELVAEPVPRGVTGTVVFQSDILRTSAITVCTSLFKRWMQDGGDDCLQRLKSTSGTDNGAKYLDVDEVIDMLFDLWCSVRMVWEDHLQFLFNANCSVYRVLGDVTFATDVLGSAKDRDVVLVNLNKTASSDCSRRPMRLIQRAKEVSKSDEQGEVERRKPRTLRQGNVNKELVCDAITKPDFMTAVRMIQPLLSDEEIEIIFNDACAMSFELITRALDTIWSCCWDDFLKRNFYVNKVTNSAQWTRTFHKKNFHTREIEEAVFFQVLLKYDVLANR